jgi:regulator of protease activity HflC (stomatin/prohibitin superfamily)
LSDCFFCAPAKPIAIDILFGDSVMVSSLEEFSRNRGGNSSERASSSARLRPKTWWERNDINVVIGIFVFIFLLIIIWPSIFVIIHSGHRGIYYSVFFGGTNTRNVLGEGFQFKLPWDKIYDYDVRIQQLRYTYSVISSDGLVSRFNISVRCQPKIESLGLLQQNIGPDYAEKIVIPETQTALRQVVGDTPIDQIYATNVTVLQKAVVKAIQEVAGKYIRIDDILITEIDIPEVFRKSIEAKLVQLQNSLQYDYVLVVARKEAERKRIEAEGIRDFQEIVTPGISPNFLRFKGIEATLDLAKSNNSKVIVIGSQNGLPLILDTSSALPSTPAPPQPQPSSSPAGQSGAGTMEASPGLTPVPVPVLAPTPAPSTPPQSLLSTTPSPSP